MDLLDKLYLYTQISFNIFSALVLISIWLKLQSDDKYRLTSNSENNDYGLIWLSCALFLWAIAGIWQLGEEIINDVYLFHGIRSFLSTFNNAFLLISLRYFDHVIEKLRPIQTYKHFSIIVVSLSIFIALLSISLFVNKVDRHLAFLPDVLYSVLTILLIGTTLITTFLNRGFKIIAFLTLLSFLLMIFSQLPEIYEDLSQLLENNHWKHYAQILSNHTFNAILLALGMSKVSEILDLQKSEEMYLKFFGKLDGTRWKIKLKIPNRIDREAFITSTDHENLLKFAVKKKCYGEDKKSLLHTTDFRAGYNAIKRIWTELNLKKLDLFMYYPRTGNYILRIPGENIEICNIKELNVFEDVKSILQELDTCIKNKKNN